MDYIMSLGPVGWFVLLLILTVVAMNSRLRKTDTRVEHIAMVQLGFLLTLVEKELMTVEELKKSEVLETLRRDRSRSPALQKLLEDLL